MEILGVVGIEGAFYFVVVKGEGKDFGGENLIKFLG